MYAHFHRFGSFTMHRKLQIESHKLDFNVKATSKVGSMDNIKHVPAGGDIKIYNEKVDFKDRASSRIGSMPSQTDSNSGDQVGILRGTHPISLFEAKYYR